MPVSPKEEAIRGQLYAGTDVITGHGIGLSGASLSVFNTLPYIHAFDTKTGMPYVCDPYKKKPDKKIDNRWKMIVPPCPDFKKCLFPWKEGFRDFVLCLGLISSYPGLFAFAVGLGLFT